MNCNTPPAVTCGETHNDSCINITGTWPACLPTTAGPCYRQSDFNKAVGDLLCAIATSVAGPSPITIPIVLPTGVTSILSSITLTSLTGCTSPIAITPVKTTVVAELQNIYDLLCANLAVSLTTPIKTGAAPGLNLKCLQDPCGTPIGTLGGVLQALINNTCANQPLTFEALLTQNGTAAPTIEILADTIDPAQANITATRTGVGEYTLTANLTYLPNGFPFGQTTVYIGTARNFTNQIIAYWNSATQIVIKTAISAVSADGVLNNTSIKISIF